MAADDPRGRLALRFVSALNGEDDDYGSMVAEAYDEHAAAPFGSTEPGRVRGPDHLRDVVGSLREQFPDLVVTVEDLVVDGDRVVVRVVAAGTNLGPLNGIIPPTGRPFRSRQSHWFVVRDGLLAEHWATRDDLSTMVQLGLVTPGPR